MLPQKKMKIQMAHHPSESSHPTSPVPGTSRLAPPGAKKSPEFTPEQAKLGKKLIRAAKVLEWEIEDFFDETFRSVPSKVGQQIETLHSIGQQFKQEESVL